MDSPDIEELKARFSRHLVSGGSFEPKYRKTVEICLQDIIRVAIQYWEIKNKPWKDSSPKDVEKEYEALVHALEETIRAMNGLSHKAMNLAWDLSLKVAEEEKAHPLMGSGRDRLPQLLLREKCDPIRDSWCRCNGDSWFTEHISKELRNLNRRIKPREDDNGKIVPPAGMPANTKELVKYQNQLKDARKRHFDWGRLRELPHVLRIAQHLRTVAAGIKEDRTKLGFGGTWGEGIWETDPEGALCRAIRDVLVDRQCFKTHAGAIAREIYLWVNPNLPENEWPIVQYFGKRRLR